MRFQPMHATVCPRHPSYVTKIGSYSRLLVEHEHAGATLKESVGSRETGKTTADDNNLGHSVVLSRREGREEEQG